MVTCDEASDIHPALFETVKVYVPDKRPVIVVEDPLPVEVTAPGLRVIVQGPFAGRPVSITLPVDEVQFGWDIVPTTGAPGIVVTARV